MSLAEHLCEKLCCLFRVRRPFALLHDVAHEPHDDTLVALAERLDLARAASKYVAA